MNETRAVSKIVFRDDLYPRLKKNPETVQKHAEDLAVLPPIEINQNNELIDGWHRWTAHSVEVSFGFMFPAVCPPSLASLTAGTISDGCFTPAGSVACHFWQLEREAAQGKGREQQVYFIRSVRGGPVKIGIAADPTERLCQLQTAYPYPLKIIKTMAGGKQLESELHRRFAVNRLNGEWFEWTQEMEDFIS